MATDRTTRPPFAHGLSARANPHDRTSAAARLIVDSEAALRAEKSARLRAIRMGHEDPDAPDADTPPR